MKERLQQVGEGTQVVGFTLKELDHLSDELGQAALYAPGPDKKRLVAVLRKVTDLLSEEHAGVIILDDDAPVSAFLSSGIRSGMALHDALVFVFQAEQPG